MTRKLYENEKSIADETNFADWIQNIWNCQLNKLPISYGLDYLAFRDDVAVSFVELKNRSCNKETYPTYMISLSKLLKAKDYKRNLGLSSILCISWKDQKGWLNLSNLTNFTIGFGGRYDRNDWQDVEPVAYIPIYSFNAFMNESELDARY